MLPGYSLLKAIKQKKIRDLSNSETPILQYPWHIFHYNDIALREDFDLIKSKKNQKNYLLQIKSQVKIFL